MKSRLRFVPSRIPHGHPSLHVAQHRALKQIHSRQWPGAMRVLDPVPHMVLSNEMKQRVLQAPGIVAPAVTAVDAGRENFAYGAMSLSLSC